MIIKHLFVCDKKKYVPPQICTEILMTLHQFYSKLNPWHPRSSWSWHFSELHRCDSVNWIQITSDF